MKSLVFVLLLSLAACRIEQRPKDNSEVPPPVTTPRPQPPPLEMKQGTHGVAEILISNISNLPLSPTSDNFAAGVLTWETEGLDRTLPVLELSIRGNNNKPCMVRPCKDNAGLVVRHSANLFYDDGLDWSKEKEHESQKIACGQGTNTHRRLAIGAADPVLVTVAWSPERISVKTPVDGIIIDLGSGQLPAIGSVGYGRFIEGVPWARDSTMRSWLWKQFDAVKYGTRARVVSWRVQDGPLNLAPCPGI